MVYGETMASHHTKDKGDLGALKAQFGAFEQLVSMFCSNVSLRVEAPKNNQLKNVRFAADYRGVP